MLLNSFSFSLFLSLPSLLLSLSFSPLFLSYLFQFPSISHLSFLSPLFQSPVICPRLSPFYLTSLSLSLSFFSSPSLTLFLLSLPASPQSIYLFCFTLPFLVLSSLRVSLYSISSSLPLSLSLSLSLPFLLPLFPCLSSVLLSFLLISPLSLSLFSFSFPFLSSDLVFLLSISPFSLFLSSPLFHVICPNLPFFYLSCHCNPLFPFAVICPSLPSFYLSSLSLSLSFHLPLCSLLCHLS